jgi:hypothetical protein
MIDVVLLTHDRLEHLVATVEALRERTRDVPIALTVVDNASGPAVRSWLSEHRPWFARIIARPANDHVPAVQEGIAATTSDPFVVTDPDLVVPDLDPSWLARMLAILDRHPDFGIVAAELDPANSPLSDWEIAALRAERGPTGDPELREGNTGMHLQVIRRDALRVPYRLDRQACDAARAAGYRVGWAPGVKAWHLGFDDVRANPAHVAAKAGDAAYWRIVGELDRPPSLRALAAAAPVAALARELGVAEEDLAVVDDPADVAGAAGRRPRAIVLRTTLRAVGGRLADELAPDGWRGEERPAVGDAVMALAEAADLSPVLRARLGVDALQHRDEWLRLLAAGAFGPSERRVFVFTSR